MTIPIQTIKLAQKGFTLIEILVVIAIVGIIVAIAVPALRTSKTDSTQTGAGGTVKTLNDAILRARLAGDTDSRINGEGADDVMAAVDYLISRGYVR